MCRPLIWKWYIWIFKLRTPSHPGWDTIRMLSGQTQMWLLKAWQCTTLGPILPGIGEVGPEKDFRFIVERVQWKGCMESWLSCWGVAGMTAPQSKSEGGSFNAYAEPSFPGWVFKGKAGTVLERKGLYHEKCNAWEHLGKQWIFSWGQQTIGGSGPGAYSCRQQQTQIILFLTSTTLYPFA